MLQITPNGPHGKDHHPAVPVGVEELLGDLRACFAAGADGVHLHVRDGSGIETLDPANVNECCARVRQLAAELGQAIEISLTTGAWIVPATKERVAMIREWEGVDCATVNLSEVDFEHVMAAMQETGIGIDVGLWAPSEIGPLAFSGFLPVAERISIELGPGAPHFLTGRPVHIAQRINDKLDELGSQTRRLTHGEGAWTWPLVEDALRRGHDTRVGFEDSIFLPSGERASSNAEMVTAAQNLAARIAGRNPM